MTWKGNRHLACFGVCKWPSTKHLPKWYIDRRNYIVLPRRGLTQSSNHAQCEHQPSKVLLCDE